MATDVDPDLEPLPGRVISMEARLHETLGRVFRPTNLELLRAISEHEPESIRAIARVVDRHPPELLENINELADYGLVELREEGRAKRPVLWYDDITIDISLTSWTEGGHSTVVW